jgi:hypothetical protein
VAAEYSVEVCKALEDKFHQAQLHRPMRIARFDASTHLSFDVTTVADAKTAKVSLVIEKFVGGGFAGQVYRVKITEIRPQDGPSDSLCGLEVGGVYAMKILIPPSSFSLLFRNILYGVGFQGPFQLQVNPAAARSGAIWQKFIRRAAAIRFGDENAVNDIHATFVDTALGSCGELTDWVDGRTWRLEVDERLDLLRLHRKGKTVDAAELGSQEYRAKHEFMRKFVELLHEMGAHEFARQYEWSTCKSQPNCLKRSGSEDDPAAGLTAVDFRAGLALLPFLPMSPGDFKLIFNGLKRGSIVQFDRGNIDKLEEFINSHHSDFADMSGLLDELKAAEDIYRNSIPDITHNHVRLLYSGKLWRTMLDSAVTGWKIRGLIDDEHEEKLRSCKISTLIFFIIGLLPFLGRILRKIWARDDWRKHYVSMLTNRQYLRRAIQGRIAEKVITWHRASRVNADAAMKLADSPIKYFGHLPISLLPAGLHRFLTDKIFRRQKLAYIFVRPVRLYFNAELREQWLRDMVTEGQKKHILSDEDANTILSQINEPFIQKYLKSLAVHICTLPVTQIVSLAVAGIYWINHPELSFWEALRAVGFILLAFQITPISPGSLVRGFYVVYLVKKEKNFKDYNIAVFLGFFKYVGYLAFPIQMTYHYPAISRFMAGHWATNATHIVPVFGERGALLEHWVFCLFYNWPLTIRRRMQKRAQVRATIPPRYLHAAGCVIVVAGILGVVDSVWLTHLASLPALTDIWPLTIFLGLVCGAAVTLGCGGAALARRIITAAVCGIAVGLSYTAISAVLGRNGGFEAGWLAMACVWRVFVFTILSAMGAILTELTLPDPDLG